ncbi:MAG: YgiQ family radical SAM protein [Thermoplasmata archaeon]|nr:YgiQ family radical SAM protein [Thermoplasmata archaeon]
MFIPTTAEEMQALGWHQLDIILVSGDTYIDSPYNGSALLGHWLIDHGFKVGIICQPDVKTDADISRLGEPALYWSVSAGCVDSMVANYVPSGKFRKDDDFTPGGVNNRRPDRACIAYSNLIRRYFKGAVIFLGGIEASLRRVVHYDFWSDSVRRSILFDAKADGITYGMSELANLELAQCLRDKKDWHDIRGICYASRDPPFLYGRLASFDECIANRRSFMQAFHIFYENCDPVSAIGLSQQNGDRYLVQNPPQRHVTTEELDAIYESSFEYRVHPYYLADGPVRAMDTIKNSITTHRGCYGECSFCAIAVHQGRAVISRSADSIVREAERISKLPGFNGIIYDVGGPTANMWGIDCPMKKAKGPCKDRKCLFPRICPYLPVDHSKQIELLDRIKAIPGVKKVFVASGIRYDMVVFDEGHGQEYVDAIVKDHVSGQLKVAPEHTDPKVLELIGKPEANVLLDFKDMFDESCKRQNKDYYLTYYFMAALPGCGIKAMNELASFCRNELHTRPEQVQVFTPTPSTAATAMYYSGRDFEDGSNVWCEKSYALKLQQKEAVTGKQVVGRLKDKFGRKK